MFFDPSGCRNCAKPVVVARKGRIAAIAGTPNSGKTTIFNALTGLHYKVANYPGATVERKEAVVALPDGDKLTLVDLPGAYSVFGDSPDEIVAANYLSGLIEESRRPDIAICVLDVCNLDRSLYLALQVVDLGLPVVFAVTMADLGERRGIRLHKELLRRRLGAPVVDVSGRNPAALKELSALLRDSAVMIPPFSWCSEPQFRVVAHDLGERYLQINGIEADKLPATSLGIRLLNGSLTVLDEQLNKQILAGRTELETAGIDAVAYASVCGHNHVAEIARRAASASAETPSGFAERLDRIFLHKFWGAIFFVLVMGLLFNAVFIWAVYPMEAINSFFGLLRDFCRNWIPEGALRSLVADGIIAGVGGVLVFIPQIALLQFFIAILEETGYLSRAAFLMDNVMRRFGLQGRSFIPLLSSFSCTVPGIMLTRSIPSWPDRMATILVAPMMSCSARLPIYTLLISAFIPQRSFGGLISLQGLVLLAIYFFGALSGALAAFVLRRTLLKSAPAHFISEMPPYRLPRLGAALRCAWDRIFIFLRTAGTLILLVALILWGLIYFPYGSSKPHFESVQGSFAARIGRFVEPAIEPLGFDWKIGVGLLTSFASRELFVTSLALVNNIEQSDSDASLVEKIRTSRNPETGQPSYSLLTAVSLLVFFVLSCQCMSTLVICCRETGSWRWTMLMFSYTFMLAYLGSLAVYQIGSVLWPAL